mmetsp:Transcript_89612/g.252623  ORF Transcript_89612/g.252623 Transcript_89612/m.252623 type:complete len:83 (+) Transcript_89612:202-450(+)
MPRAVRRCKAALEKHQAEQGTIVTGVWLQRTFRRPLFHADGTSKLCEQGRLNHGLFGNAGVFSSRRARRELEAVSMVGIFLL